MKVVFLFFLLCSQNVLSYQYPSVTLKVLKPATQVYLGESIRIPIEMTYYHVKSQMGWILPSGTRLEIISGACPTIPYAMGNYGAGFCYMNLVVPGTAIGARFNGVGQFWVYGKDGGYHWNWVAAAFNVQVTVVPHCPSLLSLAHQTATANQKFNLNLKPYIKYYTENIQAKKPPVMTLVPAEQDGLRFDLASYSLVGKPERLGKYTFKMSVKNAGCKTQSLDLSVDVKANLKDKPVFKTKPSLAAGFANHKYQMNLMELIQPTNGFMVSNQVHFRIDSVKPHPDWLKISPTDATKLVGSVPDYSAGRTFSMVLFASTNTGGDSAPLLVNIPIGYDPEQKPKIEHFKLSEGAGKELHVDVSKYIDNPGGKPVQLYIDKVEPFAPWLSHNQTTLIGAIPPEVTGQLYQLTLRASTVAGGSSDKVIIPLQIDVNEDLKPRFAHANHALHWAIPGLPYVYDFMEHHEVIPEDIPYEIELAEDYPNPGWVNIINNQLIIETVPDLYFSQFTLYVRIKNLPGGRSDIAQLKLIIFSKKIFPASGQDNDSNIHR